MKEKERRGSPQPASWDGPKGQWGKEGPIVPITAAAFADGGRRRLERSQSVRDRLQETFKAEVELTRASLRPEGGFVLDPSSVLMRKWDLVTLGALLFTATVTPYEVAVLATKLNTLFVVNRVVDAVFVWDMGIQFFLIYRTSADEGGMWIRDRPRIRRHYLRGWFTIDLVSILPFDIVSFALQDGALGKMKVLRIIRLLRLLKLVRIVRASRIFKRWETSISVSYSVLSLCKFMLMIAVVGHWLACAFALLHEVACDEACTLAHSEMTWLVRWLEGRGHLPSPHERYTLAMYWSITTLTSIGYGDIVPQNETEYAVRLLAND